MKTQTEQTVTNTAAIIKSVGFPGNMQGVTHTREELLAEQSKPKKNGTK